MAVSYHENIEGRRFVFLLPNGFAMKPSSYICDYAIKTLRNLLR
jgi:hypothetical protein